MLEGLASAAVGGTAVTRVAGVQLILEDFDPTYARAYRVRSDTSTAAW